MLATFPAQDASKTPPRRSKMPSKILWIAQDGPRGLQTCPGALQTSILTDFWSIFGTFLVHFWLPGVPGMALGTLDDHLCAGTPEKVDFSCLWGPCRSPLGDPAGTLFRLWTPPGPSWRAFGSDLLAVLVPPGFDPVFRARKHRKNVVFRSAESG